MALKSDGPLLQSWKKDAEGNIGVDDKTETLLPHSRGGVQAS